MYNCIYYQLKILKKSNNSVYQYYYLTFGITDKIIFCKVHNTEQIEAIRNNIGTFKILYSVFLSYMMSKFMHS